VSWALWLAIMVRHADDARPCAYCGKPLANKHNLLRHCRSVHKVAHEAGASGPSPGGHAWCAACSLHIEHSWQIAHELSAAHVHNASAAHASSVVNGGGVEEDVEDSEPDEDDGDGLSASDDAPPPPWYGECDVHDPDLHYNFKAASAHAFTGGYINAPLPLYRSTDLAADARLDDLRLETLAEVPENWRRWRITGVDAAGLATVYVQDDVTTAARSVLQITSFDIAQDLVDLDAETRLGACCAVQSIPLSMLERHAFFFSALDVAANSPRAPGCCCECGAPLDHAVGKTCDGGMPYALGRRSRCRRGVACKACAPKWFAVARYRRFFEDEEGTVGRKTKSYLCQFCRAPNPSYEDVHGHRVVPPSRSPGLVSAWTPVPVLAVEQPRDLQAEIADIAAARCQQRDATRVDGDRIEVSAEIIAAIRGSGMTGGQGAAIIDALHCLEGKGLIDLHGNLAHTYSNVVSAAETKLASSTWFVATEVYTCLLGQAQQRSILRCGDPSESDEDNCGESATGRPATRRASRTGTRRRTTTARRWTRTRRATTRRATTRRARRRRAAAVRPRRLAKIRMTLRRLRRLRPRQRRRRRRQMPTRRSRWLRRGRRRRRGRCRRTWRMAKRWRKRRRRKKTRRPRPTRSRKSARRPPLSQSGRRANAAPDSAANRSVLAFGSKERSYNLDSRHRARCPITSVQVVRTVLGAFIDFWQ